MPPEFSILNQPLRCRHLHSKGMYINFNMPPGQEIAGDGHVWCAQTQAKLGPDNGLCNPEECIRTDRSCYAPL
jgi:hypothetical protein